MAHVNEQKKEAIKDLKDLASKHSIIGIVNMENLPAQQLQGMRAQLRNKNVSIRMAKKRLIRLALKDLKDKKEINKLSEYLRGMPALIFTNDNPFTLFKTLQKNKSEAPAKAGAIAPKDVQVKAGPTSFMPGPIIGELGSIGIKTKIDNGKIVITDNSIVVKEGDVIDEKTAALLTRLNIKPMEVGLDLVATWEDGEIFTRKVLDIDEEKYVADLTQAHNWAFNLAIDAGILTEETTEFMLIKAFTDAKALALGENILTDLTTQDTLSKAERQMLSLKSQLNLEVTPPEKKEEQSETPIESTKEVIVETSKDVEENKQESTQEKNSEESKEE